MKNRLCIGSYNENDQPGIYIADLDQETGDLSVTKEIKGVAAPSFVLPDMDRGVIYAVEETENGSVVAIDAETGSVLSRISSGGSAPCHLALNETKNYLVVSNYMSGSIELIQLNDKGLPEKISDLVQKDTSGDHPVRQEHSHMHFSSFLGNSLYVCDLGSNTVFKYDIVNGKLCNETQPFIFSPAVGPRHFVIRNKYIYVITEMGACICVYDLADGKKIQEMPLIDASVDWATIPVIDYDAFGAAIKETPDGKYLLVSIRGMDELQLFAIRDDGLLESACKTSSGGRIPRDAEFCGKFVLAANQESNKICVFDFDDVKGMLSGPTAELNIIKPTCIKTAIAPYSSF